MRTGLLGKKLGMSQYFGEDGDIIPVTALRVDPCFVVDVRTPERDGYTALQLAAGMTKPNRVKKPQRGHFAKAKIAPCSILREFRVDSKSVVPAGSTLTVSHFVVGQFVDVAAKSIGKGFAGSMKRHNFGGGRASHGVSVSHRAHGGTGQCQDPGRVFKGKKMAGHMGAERVNHQNLRVMFADEEKGLLFLKGAVPGPKGGWVEISDSCKRALPASAPKPAGLKSEAPKSESPKSEAPKPEASTSEAPVSA